ncbi:peptide chain release factor N(5)-glutamine methyltransferase [bacterium]|nr:peptide chain release factor N(5)-glutamine methyltransferase [bacterium]
MKARALSRGEAFRLLAEELARIPHIAAPREHAAFVMEIAAGVKREDAVLEPHEELDSGAASRLELVLERARRGMPLAYALGEWYFAGRTFFVNESVLIPRPDTETLCSASLQFCRSRPGALRILEVGVGCGASLITLGLELSGRQASLVGTDISQDALAVAAANAARHGVELELHEGSLLEPLPPDSRFDLIFSNPPYVAGDGDVDESVRLFEPASAYRVPEGQPGTYFHRRLAGGAHAHLKPGGMLAMEVGCNQAGEVKELLAGNGFDDVTSTPDLSGVQRVVSAIWPG